MSRHRHFPAYDLDCEDTAEPEDASEPKTARRRLRRRRVVGDAARGSEASIVQCPFRDQWPSLEQCVGCEHFKGYSLDPTWRDSYVTCARLEGSTWPPCYGERDRTRAGRTRISEVMSDPVCVRTDLPVSELASMFTNLGLSGMPVVDEEGKPIGVVSKTDLVREYEEGGKSARRGPKGARKGATAGDVMTPGVYSLTESAPLAEAIDLMAKNGVHRVPIVSRSGHVVGILSSLDVTRWLSPGTATR